MSANKSGRDVPSASSLGQQAHANGQQRPVSFASSSYVPRRRGSGHPPISSYRRSSSQFDSIPSQPSQQDTVVPHSLSTDSTDIPARSLRNAFLTGRNRSVSFHPNMNIVPGSNASAIEGAGDIGSDGGHADYSGGPSTSGFSNFEGRSYRFQPLDSFHAGSTPFSGSYTATSHSIRDSTAALADMAMRSDGGSVAADDETFTEDLTDLPPQVGSPSNGRGESQVDDFALRSDPRPLGPSNLSVVMNRSKASPSSSSPSAEDARTLGGADSNEATPRYPSLLAAGQQLGLSIVSSPKSGLSPIAGTPAHNSVDGSFRDSFSATSDADLEQGETSSLLGPELEANKRGRGRRERVPSESRGSSSGYSFAHSRSESRAPKPAIEGEPRHRSSSRDRNDSAFSLLANGRSKTGNRTISSFYGYGAVAQAEQSLFHGLPHESQQSPTGAEMSGLGRSEPEPVSPLFALLPAKWRPGAGTRPIWRPSRTPAQRLREMYSSARKLTWRDALDASAEPIRLLPAVVLGLLLNVLDGVSYGMIMFPTSYPIFAGFGGDGVSMFFVTCIVSQLVYTLGGSIFKGGNGSMMIEVVPFFHIIVKIIIAKVGEENPQAVISTTLVAFALSSILTGCVFLLLGLLRLGVLIGFFPRHILVGCIGGVGVFLLETGLEVTGRLKSEDGFQYNLDTLRYFFGSGHMIALWLPPLGLAILLRFITSRFHHPLVFPGYFLAIPVVFYIVAVAILRCPLDDLRSAGWIFDIGPAASAPFWRFYTYLDFSQTSGKALWAAMPTQLALVFFGILHVPLNVPALGISLNEDNVNTDRELVAHGWSNILAGLVGTVPNYLCYVNSVLFYRVGGGSRLSGLMLAAGTCGIMLAGPGTIAYLPVMIVGALIFVLGIDLAKEALWDTIGRVNRWEYLTIWAIVAVMTYWDFVIGILVGIILACAFFVVQTSRRKAVRAIFDGSIARSTVRRHMTQRQFLEAVGKQTQILKLQGFQFFGTIGQVEQLIRRALDIASWHHNPIRFLIIDFSLVTGVDFSAAEAFTRIQRLLDVKDVVLVFCGVTPDSDVGVALRSVDMWADRGLRVEVFASLNEALEWTENEYLRVMYSSNLKAGKAFGQASLAAGGGLDVPDKKRQPAFVLDESFENSPRRHHLHEAAKTAVEGTSSAANNGDAGDADTSLIQVGGGGGDAVGGRGGSSSSVGPQPLPLLMTTFRHYGGEDLSEEFFRRLVKYFEQVKVPRGEVLWCEGDEADGLYLIESGILKARYDYPSQDWELNEAMLAGTIAGELTFLSRQLRNTTAHAELECLLWKLDLEGLTKLEVEEPETFAIFLKMLLAVTGEEQSVLMGYLVSRLS